MKNKAWSKAAEAAKRAVREREQLIVKRVDVDDETLAEVARDLDISRQRASQIYKRAKARAGDPAKVG